MYSRKIDTWPFVNASVKPHWSTTLSGRWRMYLKIEQVTRLLYFLPCRKRTNKEWRGEKKRKSSTARQRVPLSMLYNSWAYAAWIITDRPCGTKHFLLRGCVLPRSVGRSVFWIFYTKKTEVWQQKKNEIFTSKWKSIWSNSWIWNRLAFSQFNAKLIPVRPRNSTAQRTFSVNQRETMPRDTLRLTDGAGIVGFSTDPPKSGSPTLTTIWIHKKERKAIRPCPVST